MPHSKMLQSINKPLWAGLIVLLTVCLGHNAVFASGSFGTTVDTACFSYDGSQPYRDQGCRLCHNSSSPSNSDVSATAGSWWSSRQYTNFCTGPVVVANRAPNGTITAPASDQQISVGGTMTFQGTGSDPDGDAISYAWNFGVSSATGPGPHVVSYPNPGSYTATLTVSDGTLADPTPATRTITVQAPCTGTDADGDGYYVGDANCGLTDCDDTNAAIHPGATEVCGDGIDNNCSGNDASCSAACSDADGDGYSPDGGICGPWDCDDYSAAVNPGVVEICTDRIDNDCDWELDESDKECNGQDCLANFPATAPDTTLRLPDTNDRVLIDGTYSRILDFGGQDTYSLTAAFTGNVRLVDNQASIVNLPEGLVITGARLLADGLELSLPGGTLRLLGLPQAHSYVFGGDPDNPAAGTPLNHTALAQALGTAVPAPGSAEPHQATILGAVQANGTIAGDPGLSQNQAPTCIIDIPTGDMTIAERATLNVAGTGTDPDGNLPLTYAWDFGGAASGSSAEDPGVVTFSQEGRYQITFVVTDIAGLSCLEPATRRITVVSGDDDDDDDGENDHGDDDEH
ncbi:MULTISPECIES: PKD domain-containing protein [Thiorhodovibrio]|uniref:PKD domain-containing protein n=1 Tax=Thiorhodovibrio TaxID=61593 RepID=UPI00191427D7|nr:MULTISPECIES: PKD domain-containing protein [Thiorhodovibrio]MBK5970049.1 hypothetical protein [Thiorhodovibrio winogradskyi]WPL12975.1 Protein metal binding site [Thiorhodovibrio litoralis]